jgi:hypothetical protein
MYKIKITETGRHNLKTAATFFNIKETFSFVTLEEINAFLVNRYGKMPSKRNKVYVDDKDGNAKEIGFTHSYWNNDISHNSKKWYQTDWIEIVEYTEEPVLI